MAVASVYSMIAVSTRYTGLFKKQFKTFLFRAAYIHRILQASELLCIIGLLFFACN